MVIRIRIKFNTDCVVFYMLSNSHGTIICLPINACHYLNHAISLVHRAIFSALDFDFDGAGSSPLQEKLSLKT